MTAHSMIMANHMQECEKRYIIAHFYSNFRVTFSDYYSHIVKRCRSRIFKNGFIRSCIVYEYLVPYPENDFTSKYCMSYRTIWGFLAYINKWNLVHTDGTPYEAFCCYDDFFEVFGCKIRIHNEYTDFNYIIRYIKNPVFMWPFGKGNNKSISLKNLYKKIIEVQHGKKD